MSGNFYQDRADLYDIAFSWDVNDEVDWLLARLGASAKRILEPGCGSGRMFPAFLRRGVQVVGLDCSKEMLRRAHRRMVALGLPPPEVHLADAAAFDLHEAFDGAICPINTFGYLLTEEAALGHLRSMVRHLRPGAAYLLQVDLLDEAGWRAVDPLLSSWDEERDGVRVRAGWGSRSFDAGTAIETQVSRIEVLSGPDAGRLFLDDHRVRRWTWKAFARLVETSGFRQTAAWDGNSPLRSLLPMDPSLERARLTWHELRLPGGAEGAD